MTATVYNVLRDYKKSSLPNRLKSKGDYNMIVPESYTYQDKKCRLETCNKKTHAKSMCNSHYNQWKTKGQLTEIIPRGGYCIVDNCDAKNYSYGMCEMHYGRKKRNGSFETIKKWTVKQRSNSGLRKHELYGVWDGMKQRCINPKTDHYDYYGARGIKVCDRWMESFENFLNDMGERPTSRHTLDRTNNDGDYEPSNCRWATHTQQIHNRRMNKNNTTGVVGVYKSYSKWSAEIWVDYKKIIIGRFDNFEDAVKARKKAEERYRK